MRPVPSVLDLVSHPLALPRSRRGLIETERVLAAVRVVLALSSLLLIQLDPAAVQPYNQWILALVLLYLAHSTWLLFVVNFRAEISPRFSFLTHTTDILWPAVISLFAGGPSSPFFLYFIFALLAAAFRWGIRETAITTVAVVGTMAADAIAVTQTPLALLIARPFSITNFIMRSVYLVIFSFLIGYLAESEKRRAAEAVSISQISSKVRIEAGLKGTVFTVLQELLKLFGGRELLVITREAESRLVMLWRVEKLTAGGDPVFTWRQLDESEEQEYVCVMSEDSAGAVWRKRNTASAITLDKEGVRTRGQQCYLAPKFAAEHPFNLLLACAISAAPDVSARVRTSPIWSRPRFTTSICFAVCVHVPPPSNAPA